MSDHLPQYLHEQIEKALRVHPELSEDEITRAADAGMDAVLIALPSDRDDLTIADLEVLGR